MSVTYNGTNYYYATNLQGDVTAILNTSGTAVVTYTYDAWGNILSTGGSMASTLGAHNPLRYRGYVYDTDTGLYYLQSRYCDPEMGRFISSDIAVSTGQGLTGNNTFAYCGNNPVSRSDLSGYAWDTVLDVISIGMDIVELATNPADLVAWGALAADVASLVLPGVTGGGKVVRFVASADNLADAAKGIRL